MMRKITWLLICLSLPLFLSAQQYRSRNGVLAFKSDALLELINSSTDQSYSSLNIASGMVACSVPVSSFKFSKPMMYKHFNENYLESHLYPTANFTGYIQNMTAVNFNKDGQYTAVLSGELEIHGVTREVAVNASVKVLPKTIRMKATFDVVLEDYNIEIPAFVKDNIAKKIMVTMDVSFYSGKYRGR